MKKTTKKALNIARLVGGAWLLMISGAAASAQIPPVGTIDFYGLRSVSEKQIREALPIKEGDRLPESSREIQRKLESLPNVAEARLSVVCCEAGKAILYVGIRENGAPASRFRAAPRGAVRLPESIVEAGAEFEKVLSEAVLKGDAGEDDSAGHAVFNNPELRAVQERYLSFAARYFKRLREVLRNSADASQRALAVQVIAYHKNKRVVARDLLFAMSDADAGVRNNAMRALGVLAEYARKSAARRLKVPVEPFVEMLDSIEWTDRNKASLALARLTESRDPAILAALRKRALPALAEMARWKTPGHALMPFIILAHAGDVPDEEIQKALESGDREALIGRVLDQNRAK